MTSPGAGWEVVVYSGPASNFSTVLGEVPAWTTLSFSPLGNDAGAGSITIPLSSPLFSLGGSNPYTSDVLGQETLWRVFQDGTAVFDFLAETVTRSTVTSDETQLVTISGPGTAACLKWGMAMPTGWLPSGKGITVLSGISDPFDPGGAGVDLNLWNYTTPGVVTIRQTGTIVVNLGTWDWPAAYLGSGTYNALGSSISVSVSPAQPTEPTISPPNPAAKGGWGGVFKVNSPGGKMSFVGWTVSSKSTLIVFMQIQSATITTGPAISGVNTTWHRISRCQGPNVNFFIFYAKVNQVSSKDVIAFSGIRANARFGVNIYSIPDAWSLDGVFTQNTGYSSTASLPAQLLRSVPELQLVIIATEDGRQFGSHSDFHNVDRIVVAGTTNMQASLWALGSSDINGDVFRADCGTPTHWGCTGLSLYWTGSPEALRKMNGSEVTQLALNSSKGTGQAQMALDFQNFWCEYTDSTGTVTRHVLGPGTIGGAGSYNPGWAQYWRISCDITSGRRTGNAPPPPGPIMWRWWTSGDGTTWSLRWQVKVGSRSFDPSAVILYLGGYYSDEADQVAVQFSNLNSEITTSPRLGPIFLSQPLMKTYHQLVQACHTRGTIPFVNMLFTEIADRKGNLWNDSWSVQAQAGTDLLTLMQNYAGGINADWIMRPGLSLDCGRLGTDLHNSVVFHEGEVTVLEDTRARDAIGNVVVSQDGAGVLYAKSSASSISKWHQREQWISSGGTIDGNSAANVALASLQQFQGEVQALVLQIPPNQPGKTIFRDFGIFDWIGIERGLESNFAGTDSMRVIGITVTIDQDGMETHELILQTYRQAKAQWLSYLVAKFGGDAASALGALAPSPSQLSIGSGGG